MSVAEQRARQIIAKVVRDMDTRLWSLKLLRDTFPDHEIAVVGEAESREWEAILVGELTGEMAAAGVLRQVRQGDPIALMGTLADQMGRISCATRRTR